MEGGVALYKTLDGFTEEQLETIYGDTNNGDATFTFDGSSFVVEVGAEGTGLHIISPLSNGSYTITESLYAESLLDNTYIWQKVVANVDGTENEVVINGSGGYDLTFTLNNFSGVEFVNYYVPLLTVEKVDSINTDKGLSGAAFTLSKTVTEGGIESTYYYTGDAWSEDPSSALSLITDDDGTFSLGLWDFTVDENVVYTLSETTAPAGYGVLSDVVNFTVSDGSIKIAGNGGAATANGMTLIVRDEESLYPVTVFKYTTNSDGPGEIQGLPGATFVLSKIVDINPLYARCEYNDVDGCWSIVEWVDNMSNATGLASGEDGYIKLADIEIGSYTLTETKAPDGYMALERGIDFTIEVDGSITVDVSYSSVDGHDDADISVENIGGTVLPSTGGVGTWIYTAAGLLLIIGAGSLLICRKRRVVK